MNRSHKQKDDLLEIISELDKVKDNHRSLILISHGFIELLINILVDTKCKNSNKISKNAKDYSHATKLIILNEINVIPDDYYEYLEWFRKIRNKAAHRPLFKVTKSDMILLKNDKFINPDTLYNFCTKFVSALWNKYPDIFAPIFAPSIARKDKSHLKKKYPLA